MAGLRKQRPKNHRRLNMSVYDYEQEIEELLDKALNNLPSKDYEMLLDDIDKLLADIRN